MLILLTITNYEFADRGNVVLQTECALICGSFAGTAVGSRADNLRSEHLRWPSVGRRSIPRPHPFARPSFALPSPAHRQRKYTTHFSFRSVDVRARAKVVKQWRRRGKAQGGEMLTASMHCKLTAPAVRQL